MGGATFKCNVCGQIKPIELLGLECTEGKPEMTAEDMIKLGKSSATFKSMDELSFPVKHLLQFFKSDHLDDILREPAALCGQVARHLARLLPSNPETTAGLRKLLEAKDCFVRSRLMGDE